MVLIVTILVGIVVHLATGNFFTAYNISTLTRAASFVIIVGFGQTIVLLTGGIDLSVATIGSVCGMFSAIFMVNYGMNPYLAIIISSLLGIILGGVNGFFIAYFKMTPFIVTLATMQIYKGIVYVITKGMPITGMPESAETLVNGVIGVFSQHCDHYGSDLCDSDNYAEKNEIRTLHLCVGRKQKLC